MEIKIQIKDIEWSISRSGLLTPIAIFDDVNINGSIINRAELYHKDYIVNNKIGIGDTVGVKYESRKPMIINNYTRSGNYQVPTRCPICNAVLRNKNSKLYCTHITCKGVKAAYIDHYCTVMNIKGLSQNRIMRMLNTHYFHRLEDLYSIKNHKLAYRNILGSEWVDVILPNIEKTITNSTLGQLIYALGISNKSIAYIIEKYCRNDIDTFMYLAEKRFNWNDAGLSDIWSNYVNDNYVKYYKTINALSRILYIEPYIPEEEKNDKLVGLSFVISGNTKIFDCRNTLVNMIESYGGRVFGNLNEKISYYVDCGSVSGMKKIAESLGVKIITEDDLIDMMGIKYD